MNLRRGERVKRRISCEVLNEGQQHDGIVMDLTSDGLFVLTQAQVQPGAQLELRFPATASVPEMSLRAIVVRHRLSSDGSSELVQLGLGLRVLFAPDEYYDLAEPAVSDTSVEPSLKSFRVRAIERSGSSFRLRSVRCASEQEARSRIAEELGPDWEITEVLCE